MTDPGHQHGEPLDDPAGEVAERVAAAVGAVSGVAELHGGTYGDIATYLPGRRLAGVRVGRAGEPVEVAFVVALDRPIPAVVADVRRAVAAVCGGRPVDVTVADVVEVAEPAIGTVQLDGAGTAVRRVQ